MEITKFLIVLCCACYAFASHDTYTIPVENYETELHNLGEHVHIPETPVRIIKITKTVAVKVPVPYPVKVIEKVPYPVHISKPYPVPVPHIVKVPQSQQHNSYGHEAIGSSENVYQPEQRDYQVQEQHSQDLPSDSYSGGPSGSTHNFLPHNEDYSAEGPSSNSYDAPHSYYGNNGGNDAELFESKSYDNVLKDYIHKMNLDGHKGYSLQNNH